MRSVAGLKPVEADDPAGHQMHPERYEISSRLAALVELTREQGGTPIGQFIRAIVLDPDHTELDHRAEALLNAADRAQHLAEVVEPALAAGRHVVSDRSIYSTLAYQGYGRELELTRVQAVVAFAVGDTCPDLTLFLHVPVALSEARRRQRAGEQAPPRDRFEEADRAFFERVERGFQAIAKAEPARVVTLDATGSIEAVHASIWEEVAARLG